MITLSVKVPSLAVFEAYWYGFGEIVSTKPNLPEGWNLVIDYGEDEYRAEYQSARFASGLYFATVEKV